MASSHPKPLGRLIPPDKRHVMLYPIVALEPNERPTHVPVPIGINWYENFDSPEKGDDGRWRVGYGDLGSIRGGHALCLEPAKQMGKPGGERDLVEWWNFYDQKDEGACEGFAHARAMSLIYRQPFDAFWLYDDARRIDGTLTQDIEGTYNRSVCAALQKWGTHPESAVVSEIPKVIEREPWRLGVRGVAIKEYRWAETVPEIMQALGYDSSVDEVCWLNSWGRKGYPHRVYIALDLLERLLEEEGEASVLVPTEAEPTLEAFKAS